MRSIILFLFLLGTVALFQGCASNATAMYELYAEAEEGTQLTSVHYNPKVKKDEIVVKPTGTQKVYSGCAVQKKKELRPGSTKYDALQEFEVWKLHCDDYQIFFAYPGYLLEPHQSIVVLSEMQDIVLPRNALVTEGEDSGVYLPAEATNFQLSENASRSNQSTVGDFATKGVMIKKQQE
jgi:hypothetical protein